MSCASPAVQSYLVPPIPTAAGIDMHNVGRPACSTVEHVTPDLRAVIKPQGGHVGYLKK